MQKKFKKITTNTRLDLNNVLVEDFDCLIFLKQ